MLIAVSSNTVYISGNILVGSHATHTFSKVLGESQNNQLHMK